MPHYCIESKQNATDGAPSTLRIVEAKNAARALSHVVEDTLTIRSAEPSDYMKLATAGGANEKAS